MHFKIRKIKKEDKLGVIEMMRVFYSSDAVFTSGSDEIFESDVDECLSDSPFLTGYVFELGEELAGYAMTAHSFSTEFGKPCVWIEDLYIKEEYRGRGIGTAFFAFVENEYPTALLRLEAETENRGAIALYEKCGFSCLPYLEMKK